MNLTLHLTENCNMDCSYCIRDKQPKDTTEEIVRAACEMIFSKGKSAGFSFFGGEPLIRKDLIYLALDICEEKSRATGIPFSCKMTTNGLLLDDEFLKRAAKVNMGIGLSFEGLCQDACRHLCNGAGTFSLVEKQAKKLLTVMPGSYAMMTIAPQAVDGYYESVKYLYGLGFRRITSTIAYGKNVHWEDEDIEKLEIELRKISEFYEQCYDEEKKFFFSPFDGKISDALRGYSPEQRCHLGLRQMPVAVNGRLYACTQFIGDEDYCLGDVFTGIDKEKQLEMAKKSAQRTEPEDCIGCDLRERCTHTCGCTNRMETGHEDHVSALLCTYEKLIIGLSDELADRLFEKDNEKFYNKFNMMRRS